MAVLSTRNTLIASEVESTEKTYVAPQSGESFFQPSEVPAVETAKEQVDRVVIASQIGSPKSLVGMKSSSIEFIQELKGSGDGGVEPEYGPHAKAVLGSVVNQTADITCLTGSTTTELVLSTADMILTQTHNFLLVKDTGNNYEVRPVIYHGVASERAVTLATDDALDINEGSGEENVALDAASYTSPDDLAEEVARALNAHASLTSGYTCTYSETTGKYTIAHNSLASFDILWQTGTSGSAGTDTHIGTLLGFDDAADDTSAATYTADNIAYNSVTVSPALSNAPANGIVCSTASNYKPANSGHDSMSFSVYWGDGIVDKLKGCKGTSMSLAGLSAGQVPTLSFGFQGLSYDDRAVGSAAFTPNYDSTLPPLSLDVTFLADGTEVCAQDFTMEVAQDVTKILKVTDADGAFQQNVATRNITGSFNPWSDSTSIVPSFWTRFNNNTDVELLVVAGDKDSNDDWIEGTITAFYLPQVTILATPYEDADGQLRNAVTYKAHTTAEGDEPELSMGAL
jgi:hypothetical protein